MSKKHLATAVFAFICSLIIGFTFAIQKPKASALRVSNTSDPAIGNPKPLSQSTRLGESQESSFEQSKQVAIQTAGSAEHDDSFFVYDRSLSKPGIDDGFQRFGSQNKIGVEASVMNGFGNQVDDFLIIGAVNAARNQFVAGIGHPQKFPESKWRVLVGKIGVVNGQTRVGVVADLGRDVNFQGLSSQELEVQIEELWSLDLVGANPTLLERSEWWFNDLYTHQESPVAIPRVGQIK